MITPDKVLPVSLEQLTNSSLKHRELFEFTEILALAALFSRYPIKRKIARLELDNQYEHHVCLEKLYNDGQFYVYLKFQNTQYILIGKYRQNYFLETVPTTKELSYWKKRTRVLEERLNKQKRVKSTTIRGYKPKNNILQFKLPPK